MKKHFLRTIATLLTVVLLLAAAPLNGFVGLDWPDLHLPKMELSACAIEIVGSGTYGENLIWTLDEEGTLTISGTGTIPEFQYISYRQPATPKKSFLPLPLPAPQVV